MSALSGLKNNRMRTMTREINTEFQPLSTMLDQVNEAIKGITNEINGIHSDVCFLLNFGGLTQEEATDMANHYNAIRDIFSKYRKDIEDGDYRR